MSHAFSIAIREWGWTDDNPLRKVSKPKEPRGRVRFLDDRERERLLEAWRASGSPLLYPIVVLAIATGMRRGELLHLCWDQVDFTRSTITLHETKNGERRTIPVVGLALELLRGQNQVRRTDTDLLFPSTTVANPLDITKVIIDANANEQIISQFFNVADFLPIPAARRAQVIQCRSTRCSTTSLVPARNSDPTSKR